MSARTSYELGRDYAYFGLNFTDESDKDMQHGLTEGRLHFGHKTKTPTVYDRKWLQIRKNAIARNRVFDDSVTPKYLSWLNKQNRCPVSAVQLTQGTKTDTDWSIDRVINDGGYTRGNLIVVSNRVNQAKDNKSLEDVRAIFEGTTIDTSLSPIEWSRLFRIMQIVYLAADVIRDQDYKVLPIDMFRPEHLLLHYTEALQECLVSYFHKQAKVDYSKDFKILQSSCNDPTSRAKLKKLLNKLGQKYREVVVPVAVFSYPSVWRLFTDLVEYQESRGVWPDALHKVDDRLESFISRMQKSLFLESNGYEVD